MSFDLIKKEFFIGYSFDLERSLFVTLMTSLISMGIIVGTFSIEKDQKVYICKSGILFTIQRFSIALPKLLENIIGVSHFLDVSIIAG